MSDNILAEVTRGNIVESIHRGHIVVVDNQGEIKASVGNPNFKTYLRSSAKPLQAVPIVESQAAFQYGLTEEELAVITGSHSGENQHQKAVCGILEKLNLDKKYLQCGVHPPLHKLTRKKLASGGKKPESLHSACSGKHAGMLTLTKYHQDSLEDYYKENHPTQQKMLATVAEFAELPKEDVVVGIDGCGVPVFGMPLKNMALAYANFVQPVKFTAERQKACAILQKAMRNFPELVAGSDRFTSRLLAKLGTEIVAKDGAEGVFCLALVEKGWGIAIKIEDGSARPLNSVVLKVLLDLEILKPEDLKDFASDYTPVVKNFRGEIIGEIRPVFSLV